MNRILLIIAGAVFLIIPWALNDKTATVDDAFGYYSQQVLQQNYYDDNYAKGTGPMLRTDMMVVNQANIHIQNDLSQMDSNKGCLRYMGDETCMTNHIYVPWINVQKERGKYLFDEYLLPLIQNSVSNNERVILRVFPSVSAGYDGEKIQYTSTEDGSSKQSTNFIEFPEYVADLMMNNKGQFKTHYASAIGCTYWYLDYNLDVVYQEYDKLLTAFGKWVKSTTVRTKQGNSISVEDAILFVEFGLLGPWGEGAWAIDVTASADSLIRYYQSVMKNLPDILLVTGLDSFPLSGNKTAYSTIVKMKTLSNNRGYMGFFMDHFGSNDNKFNGMNSNLTNTLTEWVERGDFFSGEFAMWNDNESRWGGSCGMRLYDQFLFLKIPFIRASNLSVTQNGHWNRLAKVSQPTLYYINNCLSMVGFRYVMTPTYSIKNSKSLQIGWELTNIGLNRCYFDFYKAYYRIRDLKTDKYKDIPVLNNKGENFDLTTLAPGNVEPLQYSLGNGYAFNAEFALSGLPFNYSISLIIKDTKGLQNPLYLSNYERQSDGSYLIYRGTR